jgi:hypothetical protein
LVGKPAPISVIGFQGKNGITGLCSLLNLDIPTGCQHLSPPNPRKKEGRESDDR